MIQVLLRLANIHGMSDGKCQVCKNGEIIYDGMCGSCLDVNVECGKCGARVYGMGACHNGCWDSGS